MKAKTKKDIYFLICSFVLFIGMYMIAHCSVVHKYRMDTAFNNPTKYFSLPKSNVMYSNYFIWDMDKFINWENK